MNNEETVKDPTNPELRPDGDETAPSQPKELHDGLRDDFDETGIPAEDSEFPDAGPRPTPTTTRNPTDPGAGIQELEERLAAKEQQAKDLNNRYMRALADYDNLRRRSAKEVLEAAGKGTEAFVKKLLPVLDTLDQAMRQLTKVQVDQKIMDGLEMFYFQLSDTLAKEGLKDIPAKGQKFDPNLHEAMCKRCVAEEEDEIVLNEFEKGYTFKNRVLRPSKVEINQK